MKDGDINFVQKFFEDGKNRKVVNKKELSKDNDKFLNSKESSDSFDNGNLQKNNSKIDKSEYKLDKVDFKKNILPSELTEKLTLKQTEQFLNGLAEKIIQFPKRENGLSLEEIEAHNKFSEEEQDKLYQIKTQTLNGQNIQALGKIMDVMVKKTGFKEGKVQTGISFYEVAECIQKSVGAGYKVECSEKYFYYTDRVNAPEGDILISPHNEDLKNIISAIAEEWHFANKENLVKKSNLIG